MYVGLLTGGFLLGERPKQEKTGHCLDQCLNRGTDGVRASFRIHLNVMT